VVRWQSLGRFCTPLECGGLRLLTLHRGGRNYVSSPEHLLTVAVLRRVSFRTSYEAHSRQPTVNFFGRGSASQGFRHSDSRESTEFSSGRAARAVVPKRFRLRLAHPASWRLLGFLSAPAGVWADLLRLGNQGWPESPDPSRLKAGARPKRTFEMTAP